MKINQSYAKLKSQLDASKAKMQQLDQTEKDLNPAENAVKTVAENGDTFEAVTNAEGLHSLSETKSVVTKTFWWKNTESTKVEIEETDHDSIIKSKTVTKESSFRWIPGISTSDSDTDITEAKKYFPF